MEIRGSLLLNCICKVDEILGDENVSALGEGLLYYNVRLERKHLSACDLTSEIKPAILCIMKYIHLLILCDIKIITLLFI